MNGFVVRVFFSYRFSYLCECCWLRSHVRGEIFIVNRVKLLFSFDRYVYWGVKVYAIHWLTVEFFGENIFFPASVVSWLWRIRNTWCLRAHDFEIKLRWLFGYDDEFFSSSEIWSNRSHQLFHNCLYFFLQWIAYTLCFNSPDVH